MREFIFKLCVTRAYRELEKFKLWSRRTREHVFEGTFAYDFRDQHIRIDKNGQVRFKSAGGGFDRFTCKNIAIYYTETDKISHDTL